MIDTYDNDDVIITPSELSFGGRLDGRHHEGGNPANYQTTDERVN